MNALPLIIHPDVAQDIEKYAQNYESLVQGLGTQWIMELDATLGRIAYFPRAHQLCFGNVRRALLHRFPFAVGFRVLENSIRIDGIFSTKSNPSGIIQLLHQRANDE